MRKITRGVATARTAALAAALAMVSTGLADAAAPQTEAQIMGCHQRQDRPLGIAYTASDCRRDGRLPGLFGRARSNSGEPHSVCGFESTFVMKPGIDPLKPTSGTFRSTRGKAVCAGSINGTGTLSYRGRYGPEDTCDAGMGHGEFRFSIGSTTYSGTFVFIRVAMLSQFRGTFYGGGSIFGITQTFPVKGDCLTAPLTEAYSLDQTEVR